MEIVDVKIRIMEGMDKMKAIASVNFEDEFVVHDIKVIEGKNGIFVVMPSKKIGKDKFIDIAHPLNSSVRMKLQKLVIESYFAALKEEFIECEKSNDEEIDKREEIDKKVDTSIKEGFIDSEIVEDIEIEDKKLDNRESDTSLRKEIIEYEIVNDEELDKRLDMEFDPNKSILNRQILKPLTIEFEGNKIDMEVSSEEIEVLHEEYLQTNEIIEDSKAPEFTLVIENDSFEEENALEVGDTVEEYIKEKNIEEENNEEEKIIASNITIEKETIKESKDFKEQILEILVSGDRILPGEELYINDFILDSEYNEKIAEDLKDKFQEYNIDCLVAMDDVSCLLAYEVSKKMNAELLVIKRGANHNLGASIAVNYFDDKNQILKTLTLPRRSKLENCSCLMINSEIKDVAIINGVRDLLSQFNCRLEGIGSLLDYTIKHKELSVYSYSLFRYAGVDDNDIPIIY
ncbi:hypothetical protein SH2C18_40990 [Clostridium sediminicola]